MADTKLTVYDIETLINLSTFYFKDFLSGKEKEFVIHESRNDLDELIHFLLKLKNKDYSLVGFNNLFFDGQVVHWIMQNYKGLRLLSPEGIAGLIYDEAQRILHLPEKERWTGTIHENDLFIKQIDLYKQKHYDGKAKRTSLKWLEFTMRMNSIEEMPIAHDKPVDAKDIAKVLSYNKNDVLATHKFFELNKFETDLRLKLSKEFGLNLLNASEPRMAREILAKLLAQDMGVSIKELKEKRTFRNEIHLGKCVEPIVKFKEDAFKGLIAKLKATTVNMSPYTDKKADFSYSINYKGVKLDYGIGGLHGAVTPGVYTSDDDYVIKTVDVTSFYPMMIILFGFAPAHLGGTFARRYRWFFDERKKYDKKDPINYVYKIILNSTYGLSNDVNSFLYDPMTTLKTTINGQLLLSMLVESLSEIADSKLLIVNTDGLEIRIPRSAEVEFQQRCKEWESLTNLSLEHEEYKKIVFGDVNNYIGVFAERKAKNKEDFEALKAKEPYYVFREDIVEGQTIYLYSPTKLKGRFELKMEYHKDPSAIIVPKAIFSHFINGEKPEDFIGRADNLHDFCYGVKKQYNFDIVLHYMKSKLGELDKYKTNTEMLEAHGFYQIGDNAWRKREWQGEMAWVNTQEAINSVRSEYKYAVHTKEKQQKVCRYYVSTTGGKLVKEFNDGRVVGISASSLVTPADRIDNQAIPDNLSRKFYIDEAYKEIRSIEGKQTNQLMLF